MPKPHMIILHLQQQKHKYTLPLNDNNIVCGREKPARIVRQSATAYTTRAYTTAPKQQLEQSEPNKRATEPNREPQRRKREHYGGKAN